MRREQSGMTLGFLALGCVFVAGCGKEGPEVKQPPPSEVTVSEVVVREVTERDAFTGRTEAIPTVEVRPRVQGHLQKIHFKDGEMVKEGQLLFELDPRPFERTRDQARAQLKVYTAQKVAAEKEVARLEDLLKRGGASQRQVDKAVADVGSLNASIEATQEEIQRHELDVQYTKIKAEITGQIGRSLLQVGDLVETAGQNSLLATVRAQDPIYVTFDVSQRQLLRYQKVARQKMTEAEKGNIADAKIPVTLVRLNGDRYPHKGIIDFADNTIDPSTGTLRVRGRFPNPERLLLPGEEVTVEVAVRSKYKAMQVAEQAIGTDQGSKFVYVVGDDHKVQYKPVKTGALVDGLRVIEEGLNPGDEVIVVGLLRVRPGQEVKTVSTPMPGLPREDTTPEENAPAEK